ncbi:UDP-forming cellulose synthase catalytic subunit (plasmid) [Cupriavidus pinatubonensis]|uniref:UDP-forming cellulose synthase catalytic subunit n=1 Tax=Cupriavidus pinatubonensis TaxID=248026 RepID=UPI001C7335BF|nr:UDP-forming cellulose synthase catalytic subunit [Cupriavidus pinatubonensis]QYY34197.1 UDP-forming cellulose synthase catalytic subunit [Cupriavidus pinatubonensis]
MSSNTPSKHTTSRESSQSRQEPALAQWFLAFDVWDSAVARVGGLLFGLVLFLIIVTVPLDFWQQAGFALSCYLIAVVLSKTRGHLATLMLVVLSLAASSRYMYWRVTDTVAFDSWVDLAFGAGLLAAELYAFVVLLLGYFQTAWPLQRKPMPMPRDLADWPTVDIFIPTYNEPLSVVKPTVFAAMSLDWPRDKINVYVLDDGRRDEFRQFCEEVGVKHITRDNNRHAKAGNINAALAHTTGEYVAIFDCDHIPTRSFLQVCMGWFLNDSKLAMLQTPHYFFSPDPFEKNLRTFQDVPNEGELFYGLVQDGNDFWDATFFCGSCAIIRRAPLLEVGGIAVETVTEDAHTALKLHRLQYSTAYLAIPQAAGLATESLSGHIGQRIRWARGMAQICRVDNPMLGPGLSLPQRLCYLNAMLHFFYGLPRLVFLTAPLAYLLFGAHVIHAPALSIAIFALPHLLHANMTNSRIQGRFRHSFWNEVYESVLAWYITRPTLVAFINPAAGKFNVTPKGGVIEEAYFDWIISRPYLLLLGFNLLGLALGIGQLVRGSPGMPHEQTTVVLNLLWTIYNLIIIGASIAVASESRQVREAHRVSMKLPATLRFEDGSAIACETVDFAEGGIGIRLPDGVKTHVGESIGISLYLQNAEHVFKATVVFQDQQQAGLRLEDMTPAQEMTFIQCTFSRADAWLDSWGAKPHDTPRLALRQIMQIGILGFRNVAFHLGRELRKLIKRRDVARS